MFLCESLSINGLDNALLNQVCLISDKHYRDLWQVSNASLVLAMLTHMLVIFLDFHNLSAQLHCLFEAGERSDVVTQNKALTCLHVRVAQRAIFLL